MEQNDQKLRRGTDGEEDRRWQNHHRPSGKSRRPCGGTSIQRPAPLSGTDRGSGDRPSSGGSEEGRQPRPAGSPVSMHPEHVGTRIRFGHVDRRLGVQVEPLQHGALRHRRGIRHRRERHGRANRIGFFIAAEEASHLGLQAFLMGEMPRAGAPYPEIHNQRLRGVGAEPSPYKEAKAPSHRFSSPLIQTHALLFVFGRTLDAANRRGPNNRLTGKGFAPGTSRARPPRRIRTESGRRA